MATSPDLPPISQAPNQGLVGYVAAYYLPQADLLTDPVLASAGLVATDLQLLGGAGWRPLPYTPHTLKLEETPKAEKGLTTYQVRVSAQRPQPNPDVLAALASLDRRPLLLLLVEAGGGRRLIGSTEEYVLLATTGEGQNPAMRAGLELRFEGTATRRAPYYKGAVPVLGGVSLAPPAGSGGYVRLLNRRGKVLATVPAGHDITLLNWFKTLFLVS